MDSKSRPSTGKAGSARSAAVKRAKGIAETASLFLDVEGMIKRTQSQPLPFTRYVE
jgi:hypothetical protein